MFFILSLTLISFNLSPCRPLCLPDPVSFICLSFICFDHGGIRSRKFPRLSIILFFMRLVPAFMQCAQSMRKNRHMICMISHDMEVVIWYAFAFVGRWYVVIQDNDTTFNGDFQGGKGKWGEMNQTVRLCFEIMEFDKWTNGCAVWIIEQHFYQTKN